MIWGLYFAVILILEKWFLLKHLEKSKVFGHVYVIVLVVIGFVIFDAKAISFSMPLVSSEAIYYLKSYALLFVLGLIGSTPVPKKLAERFDTGKTVGAIVETVALLALLLVVTAYLVDGSFNPFLYFRF